MKILVVFTGGTIGSCVDKDSVALNDSAKYTLLNHFDYLGGQVEFDVATPYSVLSENLSARELNLLQKTIADNLTKGYDGIIVTHGTDTLQYSATALEYAFCDTDIPVVLVSAAYPLEDSRTNGYDNFEAAVEFIKAKCATGVFVSYRNSGDNFTNIHIPSRLLQHSECSAELYSIDAIPFARFCGQLELCNAKMPGDTKPVGVVQYMPNPGILCIESYPGNSYSYSLDNVTAVVLKPYHSATLDTSNTELQNFCKRATERQIPIFVVNVKPGQVYESTKLFKEYNIQPLPYTTFVSAYIKLWAAVSLGVDTKDFVKEPLAYEFVYDN